MPRLNGRCPGDALVTHVASPPPAGRLQGDERIRIPTIVYASVICTIVTIICSGEWRTAAGGPTSECHCRRGTARSSSRTTSTCPSLRLRARGSVGARLGAQRPAGAGAQRVVVPRAALPRRTVLDERTPLHEEVGGTSRERLLLLLLLQREPRSSTAPTWPALHVH